MKHVLTELPRAITELAKNLMSPGTHRHTTARQTIVVVPGLFSSSTSALKSHFREHDVYDWGQGVNWGYTRQKATELHNLCTLLANTHGRSVTIIGHSLGGVYARSVAKTCSSVERVVCLGTPVELPTLLANYLCDPEYKVPPSTPTYMIYSNMDGIVPFAHQPGTTNIEVTCSHIGMTWSIEVLKVIDSVLAIAPDENNCLQTETN